MQENTQKRIVIVGEAWGEAEEKAQAPFVGMAGKCLDAMLEEAGITREECHVTNVMHERPPGNNFDVYYEDGKPTQKLLQAYTDLANEIASCHPHVVVVLGNEPMKAILGYGGVMDYRGSVLPSPRVSSKVIPTIHPAAVLREWTFRPAVVADLTRAKKESEYAEIRQTPREKKINPTADECLRAISEARESEWCAFDIETESSQVTCIGLSYRQDRAICIPFWFGASGSLHSEVDERAIWQALKELLESDKPKKIAHNCMYELEYLTRTVGIRPKIHFDTMLAFHTLYSELPKSLAYLVSIYTDHPYYKMNLRTDKMDTLWEYNATDAVLTYECAMKIMQELRGDGQMERYERLTHSLIDPLFSMMQRGVRVDTEKKNNLRRQYTHDLTHMQSELDKIVGHPLNIGSHKQMTTWLYDELKLPKIYKDRKATGTKTLAADEEALEKLNSLHTPPGVDIILQMREKSKLLSTYLNVRIDDDKRIRCTYNIAGTETGRLSSSATAFGTGTNLQNVPDGEVRSLLVPDEGYILINADLSQAEARVVAYLAEDKRLAQVFEAGGDIHRRNASLMFNKPESQIKEEERFLAKRAVHGLNYGMGPVTFARECGIDIATAKRVYNIYFSTFPRLKLWHKNVLDVLRRTRTLTNPFGRKRIFFNKWSDSLLKEGLAFVPQSTVADMTNQAIVRLDAQWRGDSSKQLLLQVHDSIVAQARVDKVDEAVQEMLSALECPVTINGKILTIPSDVKIGENWGKLTKLQKEKR